MPPPVAAPAPTAAIPPTAIALAVVNPPANNDNVGGQPLNVARNAPDVEMRFEDVENYMIEKAKKESLELAEDLESKQMKALT